ncbi:hypothetical protein GGR42_000221 [Saonia flava]|uniref:DinB-like domain-containing protein n=1 Tax=Saonia flava TaxID=523696 RepID=A0A846QYR6_9FLAO|nr:DinB family protein [Saonia flava]NJB69759.1 hypothetical protein [Saonia flava]
MKLSELQPYEFEAFYGTYLGTLNKESDLLDEFNKGKDDLIQFMDTLPADKFLHNYDVGKWTIAEVLLHIIDTERIFLYRALRFGRGDTTPLAGFEQDDYVLGSNANERSIEDLKDEYTAVRDSSIALFKHFTEEQLRFSGTASNLTWSVAGLGFAISGHQKHHLTILNERYL